jgi:glycosyltransferase involved in cell wall biosynthesis
MRARALTAPLVLDEARKIKLVRITTVPLSLRLLITGQPEFMQQSGFDVTVISSEGEDWKKMPLPNVNSVKLNMARRISILQDIKSLIQLIAVLRKISPDIVHTHTPKAGLLGMIASWIVGVPVRIHTLAGMPAMTASGFKQKVLLWAEKLTYLFSNEVWINSKYLKQFTLNKNLISERKAKMILNGSSNGIDLKKFTRENLDEEKLSALKAKYSIKETDFIFLAVGRMVNDKGINELVNAFENIHSKNDRARLFLLGPFEEGDSLPQSTVDKIKSHSNITHVDWSDEVEYFMAVSDCFVHASYREGFPNVILQSGSMGCPVVCSDIPGNIDIVENENEGFVFPVKNASALQKCMEQVLNNKDEAAQKVVTLQSKIQNCYDRKVFHNAIKNKYLELLNKKGIDVSSIH